MRRAVAGSPQVTKTRLPQTTGEEWPDAGQLDLPVVVLFRPSDRHGGGMADAAAVRSPETIPGLVVGASGRDGKQTQSDDGNNVVHRDL